MSQQQSGAKDEQMKPPKEPDPQGAACLEIIAESKAESIEESIEDQVPSISDIETLDMLPDPPGSSSSYQGMIQDLYHSSRRYSTFLSPANIYQSPHYQRGQRHASLPSISVEPGFRRSNDLELKKLMFDSSRRSSFESAYHSQRSDPTSRTESTSQLGFLEDPNNYGDDSSSFYMGHSTFRSNEHLERVFQERRDSLSYEAIRTYFLERNPYLQDEMDRSNLYSRRRSSVVVVVHPNPPPFRTSAHQAVIDRQFEDLSNIPDPSHSRSTSIDLFGGIGVPFHYQEGGRDFGGQDIREDESKENEQDSKNPESSDISGEIWAPKDSDPCT